MASRRQAREYALQALYRSDVSGDSKTSSLTALWAGIAELEEDDGVRSPESEEVEFAQRLVMGVDAHITVLDAMISDASTNWRIGRMPVIDRNILRIATFEIVHCPDIPGTVSINESVELAKSYGTEASRGFVNGIVDRIAKKLGRV